MSTIIPRLVFGTDEYDDTANKSSDDSHGGQCSARSKWSTESSYKGIDSPRSSSQNSGYDSPRSNNGALQIVVDKTLSPGASPRVSPCSSRHNSPRGLEDSNNEMNYSTLEPKNDIATPQHKLIIQTPTSSNHNNGYRRRPPSLTINNKTYNANMYSGNASVSMKEWMENYAKDGIFLMTMGVLFLNFCDDDDEAYTLNVENFHALVIKLQLMHDSISILQQQNPVSPKSALGLGPSPLSRRKSSVESEEDLVALFVTRNLPYTPFRHELKPLIATLDRDGDGSVTFSEIKDWVNRGMCMPEDNLEKFRASGDTERKLVSFLENVMDLCHTVASNLHDDLYAHDRLGAAKLDRSGFIDILNTGARLSKDFAKKKHVKRFLASRNLKWINEEALANLCGAAIGSYLEKLERNAKRKRNKRKQRLQRQNRRRHRNSSSSDESSSSDSSSSEEESDSEEDLDADEIEEKRKEEKVFRLLRKLAFKHVNKAIEDPIKTSPCQDVQAIMEEVESRRALKLFVSSTEEEDEPAFSEISKSSEDGSDEGTHDNRRLSKTMTNKSREMNGDSRIIQLSSSDDRREGMRMQRRWTTFFSQNSTKPIKRPGKNVMDSVSSKHQSQDNIEKSRIALEQTFLHASSTPNVNNNNNGKQQVNDNGARNGNRSSFLRRFSMSKKK
jgi:hypothetical protein